MMVNTFWRRDTTKFVLVQVLVTNSLLCLSSVTGGATKCNTKTIIPEVDISSSPPDRTQPIGAAISLICEAWPRAVDERYPRRSIKYIKWYDPNGTRIGANCSGQTEIKNLSCSLLLKNLTEENFGNYTCEAENDYDGYCRRKSVEIRRTENVNLPETTKAPHFLFPEIAEDPMNQSVFIGSNVTFNCTATGIPTPAISWMKNNNSSEVTSSMRANVQGNKNNHSQLIITEVKKEDSGRYQCVASNSAGKRTSSEAFLHIEDLEFKMNQEAVKEKCSTSSQISVTILSCAIIAAFIGGMCVGFCFRTIRRSEKITFYTANEPKEEKNELQQFKQR